MFIRPELGGKGTGCLFQFTYCVHLSCVCFQRGEEFDGVVPFCIDLQLIDWTRKSDGSKLIDKIKNLLGPVSMYDEQEGSGYLGLFCRHEEER